MPHKNRETKNAYSREWKKQHRAQVSAYNKKYRSEHPEETKAYQKAWDDANRKGISKKWKDAFYDMYGRVCTCCGESRQEFLTVEHKHGRTSEHKGKFGHAVYRLCTKEYRPDLYETLCMNCNFSKGKYGYCPHEKEITKEQQK